MTDTDVVPGAAVDAQSSATALVALGELAVDPHGRRWLMLGALRGFTHSVDETWWYGERFNPRTQDLVPVTSLYMINALEQWELTVVEVDGDPTEPHGLVDALAVSCPTCQSEVGQPCTFTANGTLTQRSPHADRCTVAAEARFPIGVALVAS